VGLSEPLNTTRQLPITHSFCQWVVTGDEALVVEDARCDLVLSANSATIEMGIVAYAGVPIRVEPDETIGSFCAVDMKPRRWDARELRALSDMATVVQGLTALRQVEWLPPRTFDDFRNLAAPQAAPSKPRCGSMSPERRGSKPRNSRLCWRSRAVSVATSHTRQNARTNNFSRQSIRG
jgi:hypothetical protein